MTRAKVAKKRRQEPPAEAGADLSRLLLAAEGEDVDVIRDDSGVYFLPRSLRSLTPAQDQAVADLAHTLRALEIGQQQLERNVATARSEGLSWETIGRVVGLTGEAVRRRFSDA
jgi:hypothetical protein